MWKGSIVLQGISEQSVQSNSTLVRITIFEVCTTDRRKKGQCILEQHCIFIVFKVFETSFTFFTLATGKLLCTLCFEIPCLSLLNLCWTLSAHQITHLCSSKQDFPPLERIIIIFFFLIFDRRPVAHWPIYVCISILYLLVFSNYNP